jgi:hypothetical protein
MAPVVKKLATMKDLDLHSYDPLQQKRFANKNISITLYARGHKAYEKLSFPVKHGLFSRLETQTHVFEFNLNHEIRQAKLKTDQWLDPSEWLKRTMGNDWVYYSTGGYSGVYEAIGEYYLPNLSYPTNSLLGGRPFTTPAVRTIVDHWHTTLNQIETKGLPKIYDQWLTQIKSQPPERLDKKARRLFKINESRVTVMPPDARHVDYNIIPINISNGCLYKCRFCKIKNKKPFAVRSWENIFEQIHALNALYGRDMINYNAIFLGEHDGLEAPEALIHNTIKTAFDIFQFDHSVMSGKYVFMFASADSLLNKPLIFFEKLNQSSAQVFINVGLESFDQSTLDLLGKPLTVSKVKQAFEKAQDINHRFSHIEITCNLLMDDQLPTTHLQTMMEQLNENQARPKSKGGIYLSPLKFDQPSRQVLYDFYRLKTKSRFPTYLYIIQRL